MYQAMRYYNFGENLIKWVQIVMEGFLICTQNAGFISKWISPQKALFQDAPTSPYLYLHLGQVLSDRLLGNVNIKSIMVQRELVLLSQYADDTDIYMMYDKFYVGQYVFMCSKSLIYICLSRGNYTAFDSVYCNTQLLIFRFSFLHIS